MVNTSGVFWEAFSSLWVVATIGFCQLSLTQAVLQLLRPVTIANSQLLAWIDGSTGSTGPMFFNRCTHSWFGHWVPWTCPNDTGCCSGAFLVKKHFVWFLSTHQPFTDGRRSCDPTSHLTRFLLLVSWCDGRQTNDLHRGRCHNLSLKLFRLPTSKAMDGSWGMKKHF